MTNSNAATVRALYAQIEEICRHFGQIRKEVAGITAANEMPDAALHLNDVLQSTETATTTIIDTATLIGSLSEVSSMSTADKTKMTELVARIYEACCFQDITGQRIKKVLNHLSVLEGKLMRLSEAGRAETAPLKVADPLLQGPALTGEAPSQADIDLMFTQM